MQSRKHESFNSQSPPSRLRFHHQFESGPDPYSNGRRRSNVPREAAGQSIRRSLSPHGLSRDVSVRRRIDSDEREDYGWQLGGNRSDRVKWRSRSRSPRLPFSDMRKRTHFDEGVGGLHRSYSPPPQELVSLELRRRHELAEPRNLSVNDDLNDRKVYRSEHNDSRISKEKLTESRLSVGKHGIVSNKSLHMEDDALRGSKSLLIEDNTGLGTYWSHPDSPPVITPGQSGGRQPLSSRSMSIRHEQDRFNYPDSVALDRVPVTESYKGENPIFPSRDFSYPLRSGAHSKDFLASSSTGIRSEYQDSYRSGRNLPSYDEFSISSRKLTNSSSINAYRQRALADSSRDPYAGKRNLTFHHRRSPTRGEHDDYIYPKSRGTAVDDPGYLSDDHRMMPRRSPLDYDHTEVVYDHLLMNPTMDGTDNPHSSGNPRKDILLNNATLKRKSSSDHPDIRRISDASKHGREYLGSGFTNADFGRRISQDYEITHFSASPEGDISHRKAYYGFERDVSTKFQNRLAAGSKYGSEVHGHAAELQTMREELGIYEPSGPVLKREYFIEEDKSTHKRRTNMPGKWRSREYQDLYESSEEWDDEDIGVSHTSATAGFDYNKYIKAARVYDVLDHHFEYESDDWVPSQHSLAHAERQSVKVHKLGDPCIKGHRKFGYMSRHNLNYADNKGRAYKQHRVWKRNYGYLEDLHEGDGNDLDPSENGVSSAGAEPPEDSKEFMQMVHEAFLKYSKKLNMNTAVQRRYKEQGKAGALFCIVCGRSLSKEFMDTRRLVTHAFMSHKVGLRAEHLGLLKAVCVLLGWSTVVPSDTVTWVPHFLSKEEALAQKEDLILWPPIIIVHNVSMSDDNSESWKVVTMEALEVFLRGKGLIRGRIKMCLGKPADQSVMVVKFLGTFTGLGDAERIQKYFAEHKRGRLDFERALSDNGIVGEAGISGDSLEEQLFYGYMGIVEDLNKVDYNTRNWCVIKSKNEIQDLANAPVRPDE